MAKSIGQAEGKGSDPVAPAKVAHHHHQHELNKRIYSDGGPEMSWLEYLVAVPTLLLYTGFIHILLGLIILSFFKRWAAITVAILLGTLLLPAKPVLWTSFNRSWVFRTRRKYFKFSYLFEEHTDPDAHFIYVEYPHGVFPMGPLIAGTQATILFPDTPIYSLAANSVFSVPFWRHFVAWIGSMPASSRNFRYLLKKGCVAVIVGGIAEMFMQDPKHENIVLSRKGFVRIAIEEGADGIIPVYHFGNTSLLDIFPKSAQALSRKLKSALCVFYGVAGLPLPRRKEVFMVTGKVIPVPHLPADHPDYEKEVDRVHGLVIKAVQDLYDRYKGEYGWQDRPLVIH